MVDFSDCVIGNFPPSKCNVKESGTWRSEDGERERLSTRDCRSDGVISLGTNKVSSGFSGSSFHKLICQDMCGALK